MVNLLVVSNKIILKQNSRFIWANRFTITGGVALGLKILAYFLTTNHVDKIVNFTK